MCRRIVVRVFLYSFSAYEKNIHFFLVWGENLLIFQISIKQISNACHNFVFLFTKKKFNKTFIPLILLIFHYFVKRICFVNFFFRKVFFPTFSLKWFLTSFFMKYDFFDSRLLKKDIMSRFSKFSVAATLFKLTVLYPERT